MGHDSPLREVQADRYAGLQSMEKQVNFKGVTTVDPRHDVALRITNEAAGCGISLVASLPDNWISDVIDVIDGDERFNHVAVNREESAVGLCSGAFFSGLGSMALMGASGLVTVIYAITKINYTYEVPLLVVTTLRGAPGDHHKHHVSNGLYFLPMLESIKLTCTIVDSRDKISHISRAYDHSRTISRPVVVALTRDVLRGDA